MIGTVRVTDDVPGAFVDHVRELISQSAGGPFVLAASGGGSGAACHGRLAVVDDLPWRRLSIVFVDERCVPWESEDANGHAIALALGGRVDELASYARMSCDAGPEAYEAVIRAFDCIDLCQLGLGPDGHTASIFPESEEFRHPSEALVVRTDDPTLRNSHPRLSLTFAAILGARHRVVTVIGPDKHDAYAAIEAGEDLPGRHVDSPDTLWLVDRAAAEGA